MGNQRSIQEKQEHRHRILRSLASTNKTLRQDWSALLCDKLSAWVSLNRGIEVIATYAPLDSEADLSALHLSLLGHYQFAYPRVSQGNLSFHLVRDPSELSKGAFNIREPDPRYHPSVSLGKVDLCLCPGIGFARNGARLGRGKAYYDSTLPLLAAKAFRMGVAFDLQISDYLPVEDHDVCMTHIATPSGIRPTLEGLS
ncbi:MAG: 5-formyltetrahydrofolate cyclo-ligase [Roseibacillus sp.]|nr:5-formyltetrahydrofolate cyclo-ligase [Roseibacillus sp.]